MERRVRRGTQELLRRPRPVTVGGLRWQATSRRSPGSGTRRSLSVWAEHQGHSKKSTVHQIGAGVEDAVAALDEGEANPCGEMALAGAGQAGDDDVVAVVDPVASLGEGRGRAAPTVRAGVRGRICRASCRGRGTAWPRRGDA